MITSYSLLRLVALHMRSYYPETCADTYHQKTRFCIYLLIRRRFLRYLAGIFPQKVRARIRSGHLAEQL